jgi:tetratricopeptide (TPR) repeat protein
MTVEDREPFDSLLRAVAASPSVPLLGRELLARRFRLGRRLGEGGFGVVYEADDLRDGRRVALKLLRHAEPSWLYRFKREFRALQGLVHPNLVLLDELFAEDERWFFTMELVEGVDFIQHASGGRSCSTPDPRCDSTVRARESGGESGLDGLHVLSDREACTRPFDESKLRDGLRQLMVGLATLHAAGKVHRDIKPSNVLVTPAGRVVLIDFGLVTESFHATDSATIGTPGYMAPEQAASREIGPAADLYAVGVMLYELLTGRMPIRGSALQVLIDKQTLTPLPPASIIPGVPKDLNDLCMKLLHIDPAARPSTSEVCRLLAAAPSGNVAVARSAETAIFVGRSDELATLRAAFEASKRGSLATVLVSGESGIGKTHLIRHFLRELLTEYPGALVLEGRCHEREAIPYKTLDGIVDMLSRRLAHMTTAEVAALLPTRRALLGRLFPALLRIPQLAKPERSAESTGADVELRQRAFSELRELFTRLAMSRPTVLFIDDLQWADDDGLSALAQVLQGPDAPPLLLVGAVRAMRSESEALPVRLRPIFMNEEQSIALRPLARSEARELAAALLRTDEPSADADQIVLDAGGHPLFVEELVRHAKAGARPEAVSLDSVIWARVVDLEAPTRNLVELIAVAGAPLPQQVVVAAAGLQLTDFQRQVAILRASNLVRTSGPGWDDPIATYHDRVREAVFARLEPTWRRAQHASLARAFEATSQLDPETLAFHWFEAGDCPRAGAYAATAGDQAARTLAFDRAAAWFEQALALAPDDGEYRRTLRVKLGNALAFAGRGALAVTHFQAAAAESNAAEALALQRRAAEQLLLTGQFDRGIEASRVVLRAIGMRLPTTRFQTLASLVYYGLRLRLRGLGFRERAPDEISAAAQTRIDTCLYMAGALGFVDTIVGFVFQTRALLLALASGDRERSARSLAMYAAYSATGGAPQWRRTERLLGRMHALSEQSASKTVRVFVTGMTGVVFLCNGRFREAADQVEQTLAVLEDGSTGLERFTSRLWMIEALGFLGRFKELRRWHAEGLRDALIQQNVYAAVHLRVGTSSLPWLLEDRPEFAEAQMQEAMGEWSQQGFHLEHFYALISRVTIRLYVGDPERGHTFAADLLSASRRSLLWRVQLVRFRALYAHGGAALSMLERKLGDRERLLGEVRRDARAIEREHTAWMQPFAQVLRAGLALHQGERAETLSLLEAAARGYAANDMLAYAAAARDRAARLRGDASRAAEVAGIAELLRAEEVVAPERVIAMLLPGLGA